VIAPAGKNCMVCGEWKPIDGFHKSRNADGRANDCKPCAYARCQALRKRKQQRPGTDHIPQSKHCAKCGLVKAASDFAVYRAANDGLGRFCRACDIMYSRSRRYGLPEHRARSMASVTECECCGEKFPSSRHQHIDHRHSDGAVRGVLCSRCNTVLGNCGESPEILTRLCDYLSRTEFIDYRNQPYLEQNVDSSATSHAESFPPEGNADTCQTNTTNHQISPQP
jgi:hypothetical protein